ncbi:MAG: hypothetical protein LBR17_01195 [Bacteroidales bacterium]|jgi:hypothetical protein|nr:hypothetical protein [Bacteroidales bacterium]
MKLNSIEIKHNFITSKSSIIALKSNKIDGFPAGKPNYHGRILQLSCGETSGNMARNH